MLNLILATTLFCKLISPTQIEYAPNCFAVPYEVEEVTWQSSGEPETPTYVEFAVTNIITHYRDVKYPTPKDYLDNGWYHNATDNMPIIPNGQHVAGRTYAIEGNNIVSVYSFATNIPPVRLFSKYDIECQITDTQSAALEALLKAAGKYRFYSQATILKENDPNFIAMCQAIVTNGIVTEAELNMILDKAVEIVK